MHMIRLAALATAAALSTPVWAEPMIALTPGDDLAAALSRAEPGSVLELAGGDYGMLAVKRVRGTSELPVTLRSADPADPARLSGLDLREGNHLVFDALIFDYEAQPEDSPNLRPFQVFTTRGLTIRNSVFDGDFATADMSGEGGYPTGFGLAIRASAEILLERNEIRDFYRGIVVNDVVDITIRGNDLHAIRMDGMNFAQVERVLIEENTLRDFKRALDSGDHADMIQFWTNGTERASRDIVIRGNVLNSGHGWYTQSIFMRNEEVDKGRAGDEMFYRNVTIEENIIVNAHLHGITVGETEGLTIRHNTLVHNARSDGEKPNAALWRPQIRVAETSRQVAVTGNIAHQVPDGEGRADWTVEANLMVQDQEPHRENYYDSIFVAAKTGDPRELASFRYLPEGPAGGRTVGAPQLAGAGPLASAAPIGAAETLAIWVQPGSQGPASFVLEASLPKNLDSLASNFSWSMSDGTKAEGMRIEHSFALPGKYEVLLEARLSDGRTLRSTARVLARRPEVLLFNAGDAAITSFVDPTPQTVAVTGGTGRIPLGGANPVPEIPNILIGPIFGSEGFKLSLRLRTDRGYKGAGEILRIHQFLIVTIGARGSLTVRFTTQTSNELRFSTAATPIFSGEWVDLELRYSNARKSFEVFANGELIGKGLTSGPVPLMEHWGLALGNPFNTRTSFEGEAEFLELQVGSDDGLITP